MYTVKQVPEKTGISAYTLRFYDKEGVQCLRDTGMPLAEVKEYVQLCRLGDPTIPTRHQMIQDQVQRTEQELMAMEKRIHTHAGVDRAGGCNTDTVKVAKSGCPCR